MAVSDFRNFWILTLKTTNFNFSKNAFKIQNFDFIQKNGIYVADLHKNNSPNKSQSDIFIFACAMVKKKQLKVMTSFFRNAIFGISKYRTHK